MMNLYIHNKCLFLEEKKQVIPTNFFSFKGSIPFRTFTIRTIFIIGFYLMPLVLLAQNPLPASINITTPGVTDYLLPSTIKSFKVTVQGAGGGAFFCTYTGGKGANISTSISVNNSCSPQTLHSGGTIRLIVGQKGQSSQGRGDPTGGGGGGSALLYKDPGGSDWIILVAAGGGGGAGGDYEDPSCMGQNGGDASLNNNGGNGGAAGGGAGGSNGSGGNGYLFESYGGGGAFGNGVTSGNQGCTGKLGFSGGGSQASCTSSRYGGSGFGSGGAGYNGGGGGGGYSGGGGGGVGNSSGGGGGSYILNNVMISILGQSINNPNDGSIAITSVNGAWPNPISLVSSTLPGLKFYACDANDITSGNAGLPYSPNPSTISITAFNNAGGAISSGTCDVQSITYSDAVDKNNSYIVHRTFIVTDVNSHTATATQTITLDPTGTTVTITPATQSLCGNGQPQTLSLDIHLAVNKPLYVQWYSSSSPNPSSGDLIPGAISLDYTPPAATFSPYYIAKVTGGCSNINRAAHVISVAPTAITTDVSTTPYNIQNGLPPVLSIAASGGGLSYQWYSNTINSSTGGTAVITGSGGQTNNYTPDVSTNGTTYYYVIVSGGCGNVQSKIATVIVNYPSASVGSISGAGAICPGTSTILTLSSFVGSIQWQSAGGDGIFHDIPGATNATYTTTVLTSNTSYKVIVTSGSTTALASTVIISMKPATVITRDISPTYITTLNGKPPVLTVVASGENLSYQWYSQFLGNPASYGPVTDGSGGQTASYTPNISDPNLKQYNVYVSGTCGQAGSILAIVVFAPSIIPGANHIVYVTKNGSGGKSGGNWANATDNLQNAINANNVDQVWVSAGTYAPDAGGGNGVGDRNATFNLKNNLAIYGGFAGTETSVSQRNLATNPTILSGDIGTAGVNTDNSYNVVTSPGTDNTSRLDGFIITGGNANGGVFDSDRGGGLHNGDNAAPIIANCIFKGNAAQFGGAIYNRNNTTPTIINCLFTGNSAVYDGGAIFNEPSATTTAINSSFYGNTGSAAITNYSNPAVIENCILWGNTAAIGGAATVSYSIVQGGFAGIGNINSDPLFVDPVNGDFHLSPASPAINKGNDTYNSEAYDLDGNLRKVGIIDIGPYEYLGALPVSLLSFTAQQVGNQSKLTWSTTREVNNKSFIISRAADGNNFTEIGKVNAQGNSTNQNDYVFYDQSPLRGNNYYKLEQVDNDGHKTVAGIRLLNFSRASLIIFYPNPVRNNLMVEFTEGLYDHIKLIDLSGRVLKVFEPARSSTHEEINMSNLASGTYFLQFIGNDKTEMRKVVKE